MSNYRFYRLNEAGHIIGASDEECHDDKEAVRRAAVLSPDYGGIEVWQQDRRVHQVVFNSRRMA